MREYLDPGKPMCPIVDHIGIAANSADKLLKNLRETFKCIRQAGLKLTKHKCHFGANFLRRAITPTGVKPQKENVQTFLEKTKFSESKKKISNDTLGPLLTIEITSQDYRKK